MQWGVGITASRGDHTEAGGRQPGTPDCEGGQRWSSDHSGWGEPQAAGTAGRRALRWSLSWPGQEGSEQCDQEKWGHRGKQGQAAWGLEALTKE